jgi:DNA recombination protein RmuC
LNNKNSCQGDKESGKIGQYLDERNLLMTLTNILIAAVAALSAALIILALRNNKSAQNNDPAAMGEIKGKLDQITQMASTLQVNFSTQLQNQERNLTENLRKQAEATGQKLGDLQTRLAVMDKAQASLAELSEQTTRLENVLSNKQARGAYGEIQLENLVQQVLPPNAYEFQATLSNGSRPDCLLKLPNPPGPIVIDAKFPLEAWYELGEASNDDSKTAARKKLNQALSKHVNDIASKYMIVGETAESAILFLPSEAVYAEIHTNLAKGLENSFKQRVYIASPTTLMATLNTVRAILRDVKMREQATVIQAEVGKLMDDIRRLDDRVGKLSTHFNQAQKDVSDITTSTQKITRRGGIIEEIDVQDTPVNDVTPNPQDQLPEKNTD